MFLGVLSVLGAIALLLVLIVVHEAGHFFAARFFGMQTPVVGLGLPFFGPTWLIGKYKEVEFRFHPVLLGAYVAIPEMDDESSNTEEFNITLPHPKRSFPAWQRMIVSFAGPGSNFIFALLLAIMAVTFVGVPKEFYISQISSQASAEVKSKLREGDQIIKLNDKVVKSQYKFINTLKERPNQEVNLWLQRSGNKANVPYCIHEQVKTNGDGRLNIMLAGAANSSPEGPPVIAQLSSGWEYFAEWFSYCINMIGALLASLFHIGAQRVNPKDVHGIIVATDKIAEMIRQNVSLIFQWGALFSIELGIINLIPMLPLDGGHILFQAGEIVSGGRKLNKFREYVAQAGLVAILLLTVFILFNDFRYYLPIKH